MDSVFSEYRRFNCAADVERKLQPTILDVGARKPAKVFPQNLRVVIFAVPSRARRSATPGLLPHDSSRRHLAEIQ